MNDESPYKTQMLFKSREMSQRRQFCRKCVPKKPKVSQWYENSLATGEDCSGFFRILLRVSSAWRWPFSSQDLVADAGFHLCGNGPLRRTNKMSYMLETNNLDLKSVPTNKIHLRKPSLCLCRTNWNSMLNQQQRCPGTSHFRRLHILLKLRNDVNHIHTEPCA